MQRPILARLANRANENSGGGGKRWRWIVLAVAALAVAAWILHERIRRFEFDFRAFAASFLELEWQWIVAAAAFGLLAYYGRALRWSVMLRPLQSKPATWAIFKATAIGFTAVVLLGRPGEFVRPYLISLKQRVPFSSQLAAWVLERILDLLAILILFGFAIARIGHSHASPSGSSFRWVLQAGGYVAAALGLVCLAILIMLGRFSGTARRRLIDALSVLPVRHHEKVNRFITAFIEGTAATKTQASAGLLGLYTILEWTIIVLSFDCLFNAYAETASFGVEDVLIFLGLVSFGGVIQIPGIGGGIQLVSIVVLTEFYGISLETATSLAIMLWLVTFVVIVPTGLFLAFHEGLNWRKFRDLERRAVQAGTSSDADGPDTPAGDTIS